MKLLICSLLLPALAFCQIHITPAAPPTIAGCMTAPVDSVFNNRVDGLPVHPSSGSWTPFVTGNGVSLDFTWGINIAAVPPRMQRSASSIDHPLLLVNPSTCRFYETNQSGIRSTYPSTNYRQLAGLPLAPLLLHLSELRSGVISHALRFTACTECIGTEAVWPALATSGLQPGAPPLGARFRLKAGFDTSYFPPYAAAVLTALKRYGMILAGTGPDGQISAATDVTADRNAYQQLQAIAAANLTYTDFEAVDESSLQLANGSYAVNPANPYVKPAAYTAPIRSSVRVAAIAASPGSTTYTLQQFDPACGRPGYDCHNAFQLAFTALSQTAGGTLQLPAGTFTINFPGVSQNVPGGAALARNRLLVVPANTTIQGHLAADGTPDSIIEWQNTSTPVFIFDQSSHSGLQNLHLRFTGTMPQAYPYGDVALLKALGYNPVFPHQNQMSGNNAELFSFAYVFDSDYCTFDHLLFDSATHDNAHTYAMAINLKGKGVVVTNGGGLSQLADSNRITNIQVYDFNNAFLVAGQNNFLMQNVTADRRGSMPNSAPGHLLYTTSNSQFDMNGQLVKLLISTNTTVQNLTEGPNTYSNASAGGTLALKFLNGAVINNVVSRHPEGLIQTIYVDQNVTFSSMSWTSNYALCANVPANCSTPAIYTDPGTPDMPPTKNLTFQNISLASSASPTSIVLMGDNLQVNGLQVTTLPDFLPGQQAMNSILNVSRTSKATITGYVYTPLLSSYNANVKYNSPFTGWNPSSNVTASVTMNWPKAIPLPSNGSSIITPGFQTPASTNHVTRTIKLN